MPKLTVSHSKLILALLIFWGTLHASKTHGMGVCKSYSVFLGGSTGWIYSGKIGPNPVRIMIHYDEKSRKIVDEYGFSDARSVYKVVGQVTDRGKRMHLLEEDAAGQEVGNMKLAFGSPSGISNETECTYLTGEEASVNSPANRHVSLNRVNPLALRFNKARKLNERAAYQIQMDLKNNDAASFASFVAYPLNIERGGKNSVYHSPPEVIKGFRKIVNLNTRNYIISSAPMNWRPRRWDLVSRME